MRDVFKVHDGNHTGIFPGNLIGVVLTKQIFNSIVTDCTNDQAPGIYSTFRL